MALQSTRSFVAPPRESRLNPDYQRSGFRISFRFGTPRKRRVLLVQLVSMEVGDEEESAGKPISAPEPCLAWCESYARLLDEHQRLSLRSLR